MTGVTGPTGKVREFALSFIGKGLLPGQVHKLTARPQVNFRPTRLVVDDTCSDARIHDLSIGGTSQLAGSIPASAFDAASAPASLSFSTATVATEISMTVSRPQGGDFRAALFGVAADASEDAFSPAAAIDADFMKVAEDHIKEMDEKAEEHLKDEGERLIIEELE